MPRAILPAASLAMLSTRPGWHIPHIASPKQGSVIKCVTSCIWHIPHIASPKQVVLTATALQSSLSTRHYPILNSGIRSLKPRPMVQQLCREAITIAANSYSPTIPLFTSASHPQSLQRMSQSPTPLVSPCPVPSLPQVLTSHHSPSCSKD